MAVIKEFSAVRFTNKGGNIGDLCCPPYDIISDAEKQEFLNKNKNNIIKLELPDATPQGYKNAADTFKEWMNTGILAEDSTENLYIYEEEFSVNGKKYAFRGFTCRVQLAEFSEGVVLPHEETLSKAKADRFNLLESTGCSFSQIYGLYRDAGNVTAPVINELSAGVPNAEFCDAAGVTHRLWVAQKSEKTAEIVKQFKNRKIYIADGHHRYETALNFRRYLKEKGVECDAAQYVMMFLVNMENSGLVVFPTHRIVRDVANFNGEKMLKNCEKYFTVTEIEKKDVQPALDAAYNAGQKAFVYADKHNIKLLVLKDLAFADNKAPEKSESLRRLDVSVLHNLVLEECFKIDKENMANQKNLTYTRSADEAFDAANTYADCAFILNPTRITEIADVAAAGEKMPQKSTYFYPKLVTGLVINKVL